ncbi:rhomboid family intramembrane serine protease [Algicella marina]|uniref:Rhomboid family intramembrane serine protease n=1 Tax=Algicella marina TaxID=2683284 RepID=A0A6P1T8P6_9RHOB|nr:rhomboid family intramembrane serine protease [Algicella marina]QHQ36982.1 rhomboid family intramembrane serine protease [Algicella marina]
MHNPDQNASPFNALPPVLVALALAMGLIEVAFQLGARGLIGGPEAVGWRIAAAQRFGFVDQVFEYARATGTWNLDTAARFFTYPFIHQNATHALFAVALLLAIGNYASRVFSGLALAIVFVAASFCGALAHGLIMQGGYALLGAYPPLYGFLGLMTWTLWIIARQKGENPIMAFRLVGVLVALQLLFFVYYQLLQGDGGQLTIASEAAGFLTGFGLAPLLIPGGLRRLRARLQNR